MAKKTIYKSVIIVEVLSEEPIESDMLLREIADECDTGSFSGIYEFKILNQPIKGVKASKAIMKQGSSPDFFQMDENGNEIDF
jgi:hypothetical protein